MSVIKFPAQVFPGIQIGGFLVLSLLLLPLGYRKRSKHLSAVGRDKSTLLVEKEEPFGAKLALQGEELLVQRLSSVENKSFMAEVSDTAVTAI